MAEGLGVDVDQIDRWLRGIEEVSEDRWREIGSSLELREKSLQRVRRATEKLAKTPSKWTGTRIGIWIWGGITVALAAAVVVVLVWAGAHLVESTKPPLVSQFDHDTPRWVSGLFFAFKDNGSLLAGVLGFSGLAWAHFFNKSED
jgi:hypothetical protein